MLHWNDKSRETNCILQNQPKAIHNRNDHSLVCFYIFLKFLKSWSFLVRLFHSQCNVFAVLSCINSILGDAYPISRDISPVVVIFISTVKHYLYTWNQIKYHLPLDKYAFTTNLVQNMDISLKQQVAVFYTPAN